MLEKVFSHPVDPLSGNQPRPETEEHEELTPLPAPREFHAGTAEKAELENTSYINTEPEALMSETARIYNLRLNMHEDIPRNQTTDVDR